jgi:hypothetical protein
MQTVMKYTYSIKQLKSPNETDEKILETMLMLKIQHCAKEHCPLAPEPHQLFRGLSHGIMLRLHY